MSDIKPIFVSVKEAARVLDCSTWKVYELLNAGRLDSKYMGASRKVVFASLEAYASALPDERART